MLAALEQSLSFDRAPVQISPMTEFGIVAITRKRVREPLARLTSVACAGCGGRRAGAVRRKRGAGDSAPGRARGRRQSGAELVVDRAAGGGGLADTIMPMRSARPCCAAARAGCDSRPAKDRAEAFDVACR